MPMSSLSAVVRNEIRHRQKTFLWAIKVHRWMVYPMDRWTDHWMDQLIVRWMMEGTA